MSMPARVKLALGSQKGAEITWLASQVLVMLEVLMEIILSLIRIFIIFKIFGILPLWACF